MPSPTFNRKVRGAGHETSTNTQYDQEARQRPVRKCNNLMTLDCSCLIVGIYYVSYNYNTSDMHGIMGRAFAKHIACSKKCDDNKENCACMISVSFVCIELTALPSVKTSGEQTCE